MAKARDKNVFDVSKPGKSAPSATSRPIITGHGPMLKDPMVSDKQAEEKPVEETPVVKTTAKVIEPAGDIKPEEKGNDEAASADKVAVKVEEPKKQEPQAKPHSDAETSTTGEKSTETLAESADESPAKEESSETASSTTDDTVDQALKPQEAGPTKEEIARQQQIEGLIEAETYFLPIGQVTRRKNNRRAAVILTVILLLVLVGGYLTLDAGLIETNFELPVDLINN